MKLGKPRVLLGGLMLVSIAMAAVFFQNRYVDIRQHQDTLALWHALKAQDQLLDRQVLQVSSLRLKQYDDLVDSMGHMRLLVAHLQAEDSSFQQVAPEAVAAIVDSIRQKLHLLEHVQFQAAIQRNTLLYLPTAVGQAAVKPDAVLSEDILQELLLDVLAFDAHSEMIDPVPLLSRLQSLRDDLQPLPQDRLALSILRNMETNLKTGQALEQALKDYFSLSTAAHLQRVYDDYAHYYARRSERAERVSVLLLVMSLGLMLAVIVFLRRLERTRDRLHDAVESVSEGFALFDRNDRLMLWNSRFAADFPSLKESLEQGMSLEALEQRAVASGEYHYPAADGPGDVLEHCRSAYADDQGETELQHADGRYTLLRNRRTREGGRVVLRIDITDNKRRELELRKFSRALEQSPTMVVMTDARGVIEYVNPMFSEVTGFNAAEACGRTPALLKSGQQDETYYRELWQTVSRGETWRGEFHNRKADGSLYWESAIISPLYDDAGEISHFIAIKQDITGQKAAEDQFRLIATVFENTAEAIMLTDRDAVITDVNPAFSRITGFSPADVIGKTPAVLSSGRHQEAFYQELWQSLENRGRWEGEIWNRRKQGEIYPEWLSITAIRDQQDEVLHYVGIFSDMTKRKQDEEQIIWQANYDSLTQLPNRSLFFERLRQALANARRHATKVALLFIDLDRFKPVNDTLGHAAGDELLRQVAERLEHAVRRNDTVARLGGDEFSVILGDVHHNEDAALIANKLLQSLARHFVLQGQPVYIGASIGIVMYPEDAERAEDLVRNADMAMYRAKELGRNNYQFFTADMNHAVMRRLKLENDLRRALAQGEFTLHFQPIIDTRGPRLVAAETLVRWDHPQEGLVSPAEFIPLAEETGIIGPLGEWVLAQAIRQAAAWQARGLDLRVSVNVSSRQIQLGLSADFIVGQLQQHGLPPSKLTLELTESLFIDNTPRARQWLQDLKTAGVSLAVDDFGTGYSALSYLKQFPIDILKIDRSFTRDVLDDPDDAALMRTMILMGDSLRLKVVAEGVETAGQLDFLHRHGCHLVQGFHFSRPLPAIEFEHYARHFPAAESETAAPVPEAVER